MTPTIKPSLQISSFALLLASVALIACTPSNDATGAPQSLTHDVSSIQKAEPMMDEASNDSDWVSKLQLLENRVAMLETEMNAAKPTLAKVDIIERQFRSLSLELDRIDGVTSTPLAEIPMGEATKTELSKIESLKLDSKKTTEKPKTKPVIESKKTNTPVSGSAITNVRFGSTAKDKTRIVLDATKAVSVSTDLDNQEKILVMEIDGLDWKAAMNKTVTSSPLVSSYSAQKTATGSRLIIQLKQSVKLGKVQSLKPEGVHSHRSFVDLTAQ
jgi:hypothetical protein